MTRSSRSLLCSCIGVFVGMLLVVLSLFPYSVVFQAQAAAVGAKFALQPVTYDPSEPETRSYFIFTTKFGTRIQSRVRIVNSGTQTGTALLYGVDATTGQTSGAVYLTNSASRQDVGSWLTLNERRVTLQPGQSQIVTFWVTIPKSTRSGQHVGGIVAENTSVTTPVHSNLQVDLEHLTIIAVQVNLPPPFVKRIVATGITAGGANLYQRLFLSLRNTGTMMLKPTGTLRVTDKQGHVRTWTLQLDTFLPQTGISYPVPVTGNALGVGSYQATLDLAYADQTLHYQTSFNVTATNLAQVFKSSPTIAPSTTNNPVSTNWQLWQVLLGVLLLILLILVLLWFLLGRRRKKEDDEQEKITFLHVHKSDSKSKTKLEGVSDDRIVSDEGEAQKVSSTRKLA